MADSTPKSYHTDPTLYLYTSLTSGSSHIISATSRMQTILKANRIEYQALDVATDEKARMLWGRRAGKRKLPGLVRFGMIVGDLEEVEEWNEYGELKENVNPPGAAKAAPVTPSPSTTNTPSKAPAPQESTLPTSTTNNASDAPAKSDAAGPVSDSTSTTEATPASPFAAEDPPPPASGESTLTMAMRQAGFEAAKKAGDAKTKARQEELERLKAKSADLQKLDNAGPTGMPPPSGTTEAEEAKKPETGVSGVAGTADDVPPTEEGEKEATSEKPSVETDGGGTESTAPETASAAEKDMAMSANDATKEAAEPEELEGEGQAEPEVSVANSEQELTAAMEQPAEEAVKTEPQRIPNAKEAEEEANKAIIADEASHVHIAGSPPPYASPGMRPPKDEEQEASILPSTPLRYEVEKPGTDSSSTATESKNKTTKEEDDASKVDNVETTVAADSRSKIEPTSPSEQVEEEDEATTANTEQNKTGTTSDEPGVEESNAAPGVPDETSAENESKNAEEPIAPSASSSETDDVKKNEEPSEVDPKPIDTADPTVTDPTTAATETHEPQKPAETKTQEQPAASGEEAGESVGD